MTQTKMYQPQVNNNNNINSALDCAESRTVRTINTKQLQQQQQTVKVPSISAAYVNGDVTPFASATDFITGHTVTRQKPATKVALTAEMQNAPLNCQTRSFRRMPMMSKSQKKQTNNKANNNLLINSNGVQCYGCDF